MQTLLRFFSVPIRERLSTLPIRLLQEIQEIRIRERGPLEVGWGRDYGFVTETAGRGLCDDPQLAYRPTREDCAALLETLTQHSLYTYEEELRRGYITVVGGHRVGLAGHALLEEGKVRLLKDISGFNIRIAKECKGAGERVLPYLLDDEAGHTSTIHHTLIVSPPQQGKTTLIRDLARLLSSGRLDCRTERGRKVGVVDERSEIAACVKGVPTFDLGPRTDVLDGCPKAEGMMMMIRSLSPEIIIVDEIGRPEDAAAIHEAIHAGIRVIATAHGLHYDDVKRRPVLRELMAEGVFGRIVVLCNREAAAGTLQGVYDAQGRSISLPPEAFKRTSAATAGAGRQEAEQTHGTRNDRAGSLSPPTAPSTPRRGGPLC